jgi:hypothetical protein
MSEQPFNFPLEDLITTAANSGSKSITLVCDKDGRYQASVQKGNSSTFKVHVANNPVQALYGALAGIDGLKVFDAIASIKFYVLPKPTDEPVAAIVDPEMDDLL